MHSGIFILKPRQISINPIYTEKKYIKESIDFFTEKDMGKSKEERNPSLHLGKNLNEVMVKYQSSRLSDKKAIDLFIKDMTLLLNDIESDNEVKKEFGEMARSTYKNLISMKELPFGFVNEDLDLMDEEVQRLCGFNLIERKTIKSRLGSH